MAPPVVMPPPARRELVVGMALVPGVALLEVDPVPLDVVPVALVFLAKDGVGVSVLGVKLICAAVGAGVTGVVPVDSMPFPVAPPAMDELSGEIAVPLDGDVLSSVPPVTFCPSPGATAPAVAGGGAVCLTLTMMLPNCSGSANRPR